MKVSFVLAALAVAISPALAAVPITPEQAVGYQGSLVTVQGPALVRPGTALHDGGVEVALGSRNNTDALVAYIPKGNLDKFPDLNALNGQVVDVTGVVEIGNGAQIRVTSPDQLSIAPQ